MSEGPHRNLPMSPGWKRFAARVCNEAFNHEEVRVALVAVLEQDGRQGNMESLVR